MVELNPKLLIQNLYRRKIFEENVDYMNKHNFEAKNGKHTFTLGINEYSDLSTEEWKKYLLGLDVYTNTEAIVEASLIDEELPDTVDWRKEVLNTSQ